MSQPPAPEYPIVDAPAHAVPYAQPVVPPQVIPYRRPDQTEIPFTPTDGQARFVIALFYVCIMLKIVSMISTYFQIQLLEHAQSGVKLTQEEVNSNDIRQQVIGVIHFVNVILVMIFYLRWLYRSYRNQLAMGTRNMRMSPGWAVGYWFIPILSLFRPYQAVKELYQASDPNADDTHWNTIPVISLIGWWWAFWIVSSLLSNFSGKVRPGSGIGSLIAVSWTEICTNVISIVAAFLGLKVVRIITDRQADKYSRGPYVQPMPLF